MTTLKTQQHLTLGYEPELARQIAQTHVGQAHWAHGGPRVARTILKQLGTKKTTRPDDRRTRSVVAAK
jgi:hypothetical protein